MQRPFFLINERLQHSQQRHSQPEKVPEESCDGGPCPPLVRFLQHPMRFHHMSFVLIPIPKAPGPTWQLTLNVRRL